MLTSPQQDWKWYRQIAQNNDLLYLRNLSTADRWNIYRNLFRVVWSIRRQMMAPDPDQRRWQEKLGRRYREIKAFQMMDRQRK